MVIFLFTINIPIGLNQSYAVLKENWNIEVANPDQEIYDYDSGEDSFLGDGIRYHVIKYTKEDKIKSLMDNMEWITTKNNTIEEEVTQILDSISIDKKYYPNFNNNYIYYTKHDIDDSRSQIYLFYYNDTNELYIIEEIF
jgi:hypothetical protein